MIKHLVLWTIKSSSDGRDKEENIRLMTEMLMQLPGKIPAIREFEVVRNVNPDERNMEVALVSVFESLVALNEYLVHPEHRKVGEYISSVTEKRSVIDYEF